MASGINHFFGELKRRNVVKVGVAYLVVGWILIEASSVLMPAFGAPDWVFRIFALIVVLGFPLALIFAWAFEMTSAGLMRSEDVPLDQSITPKTGRKLDFTIIGLLVIALGISVTINLTGTRVSVDEGADGAVKSTLKSIAVLPFVNMSSDKENEYFSDGIAEELLNVLVKVQGLEVSSRTSSFAFKGKDTPIPEIADRLGVDHVLEGSVRKAGNTVRITAQLIDVQSDKHLWSASYDRELEDIFVIQEEIAKSIVDALKVALGTEEKATIAHAQNPTDDLEAYQMYLRGRYLWQQRGIENIRQSIRLFQQAINRDPAFARAYSNMAAAYAVSVSNEANEEPPDVVFQMAEEAALKAIELDGTLAEPHAVLGLIQDHQFRWAEAEESYRSSIALQPRGAIGHFWLGIMYSQIGRIGDAVAAFEKAVELEPTSYLMIGWLAYTYFINGDNQQAYESALRSNELTTRSGAYGTLALYHVQRKEFDKALDAWEKMYSLDGDDASHVAAVIAGLRDPSKRDEALQAVHAARERDPLMEVFWHYRDLGELDLAYDSFEVVAAENPTWLSFLWDPDSHAFRQHERFKPLVDSFGFPVYWREAGWPDVCQPVGTDDFECD